MTQKTLAPLNTMPIVGLGTFKAEAGVTRQAVIDAVKIGYRHIDCAPVYGNQAEIGSAVKSLIDEGLIQREQLWITSKLWNDSHLPEDVRPALEQTLVDLQLEYLDLYLIHWPVAVKKGLFLPTSAEDLVPLSQIPLAETWQALEEMVGVDLCKRIGVSNFSVKKLKDLALTAKIKPFANQVEIHPYLPQHKLSKYCQDQEIMLTAYSPLGSPDRPERIKVENEPVLMQEPAVLTLAEKHGVTSAQILLNWLIMRGIVVIPKSVNKERLKQNLDAATFKLTTEDVKQIDQLDRNRRYYTGANWTMEGSSYRMENLWDE